MKFCIEIDIADDCDRAAQVLAVSDSLVRLGRAVMMLGCIPTMAPMLAEDGARQIGRAWRRDEKLTAYQSKEG